MLGKREPPDDPQVIFESRYTFGDFAGAPYLQGNFYAREFFLVARKKSGHEMSGKTACRPDDEGAMGERGEALERVLHFIHNAEYLLCVLIKNGSLVREFQELPPFS